MILQRLRYSKLNSHTSRAVFISRLYGVSGSHRVRLHNQIVRCRACAVKFKNPTKYCEGLTPVIAEMDYVHDCRGENNRKSLLTIALDSTNIIERATG
jgi:hypothetical protein